MSDPGRVLAVDPGTVRHGVAVSDALRMLAHPLVVLPAKDEATDAAAIADLARREEAVAILIGLPLHMDGRESPGSTRARSLAEKIAAQFDGPVELVDERLTTSVAHALMAERKIRRDKRKRLADLMAAVNILQDWLDREAGS
ncbi:Holliday junction resolvase RuvX [bacterium]|nr:Holliday junction resolvase RuvX [bacterium]